MYRLKVQNFKRCRCAKFSPCHCKSKIPAHLKLSTQMSTLNIFELKQRFRKSVEYLWRYRILAGTVYRLKVAKFQMLSMRKVFTLPICKSKIPAHLKLSTQIPTLTIFELQQSSRKSVWKPLEILNFMLAQSTGWKWQTFKCCRCAKFLPCHCKSKIPAHLKLYTQMPTLNIFELRQTISKKIGWILLEI